jgi:DNA repair exonuclease SbcCD ATPase subunit
MTIDKAKLKAEAQRLIEITSSDPRMGALCRYEYLKVATPETLLALLAEIERLERVNGRQSETIRQYQDHFEGGDSILSLTNERDQLKAENEALRRYGEEFAVLAERRREEIEALRKDAERMEKAAEFVQQLRNAAGSQPSMATGYLDDILSAMSKESSHD